MDALESYLATGDLDNAAAIADGRIRQNPNDIAAYVALARIAAAQNDIESAVSILKDQFARHPSSPLPPSYLAVILEAQGDVDRARALAQRAVDMGSELPQVFAIVAAQRREENKPNDALAFANFALQRAPKLSSAHLEKARAHKSLGALSESEDAYIQVLEYAPQRVDAWKELIVLELGAGAHEIARENLSEALRLHPGHPELLGLAKHFDSFVDDESGSDEVDELLHKLRLATLTFEFALALDTLDDIELVARDNDKRLLMARAEIAIACGEGDVPPLVHALTKVARQEANDWRIKTALGRLLLRESAVQNPRLGSAHLEDAWRISGEHEEAGLGLVEAWAAIGKSTFAKALCQKLAENDSHVGRLARGILDGTIEV